MAMTQIRSELFNDKTVSMWLTTIAILAFATGYGLASIRHSGQMPAMEEGGQIRITDLAMGKYGHLSHRP
jgi:hypothetical protein